MKNIKFKSLILATTLVFSTGAVLARNHMSNNSSMNNSMMNNGNMMNGGCNMGMMGNGHMMKGGMMKGGMMKGGMMNGGMMNGGMMNGGMMFSQLDLSAEQQQKIQTIMADSMAQMQGNMSSNMNTNMASHMAAMQALMNSPKFDEQQANAIIGKQQAMMSKNKMQMLRARHAAYQVLTKDQKAQLQTLMSQHMSSMQQ